MKYFLFTFLAAAVFDSARKKIYTNDAEENVWVYDVSYLYQ